MLRSLPVAGRGGKTSHRWQAPTLPKAARVLSTATAAALACQGQIMAGRGSSTQQ